MAVLASDIINAALRDLRVVDSDSTADPTQLTNGLAALNAMIDSWNTEKLTLYEEVENTWTVTGAASYTIGSGGVFNGVRPERIVSAFYRLNSVDYGPLQIIGKEEWDLIPVKTLAGSPALLWYDMAYPLGVIHLYPNPASGSLLLTTALQLTELATSATAFALPPGYRLAMIKNLAIQYSPQGGVLTPTIERLAAQSLGSIKRANNQRGRVVPLDTPHVSSGHSNILTG